MEYQLVQKQNIQELLSNMLSKYTVKYIQKVYDSIQDQNSSSSHNLKNLQLYLLDVPTWSERKLDKEYNKFLKWTSKKYNGSDFQHELEIFITLTKRLILYHQEKQNQPFKKPVSGYSVFVKTFRVISKYIYENPALIDSSKRIFHQTQELALSTLQSFVPLSDILKLFQQTQDDIEVSYHFGDTISTESTHEGKPSNHINDKLSIDNNPFPILKYIPENIIGDDDSVKNNDNSIKSEDNNIRTIHLPKSQKERKT
jgi:hypothetical protein